MKGLVSIPSDVAFVVQSFLSDEDRCNSEQVSLNFHHACNALERLEFRDRLQNVELELIREKYSQSSIASGRGSHKRVFSHSEEIFNNDDIEKEIEEFESKHIKIPFHLKEYLRMSIHLDPYLISDILKEYVFMHPLTVLCPLSDWSVIRQGEEYLIGEFSNTTGNDMFMFTLKKMENGKCSIFMSIIKSSKYGDDEITKYSTTKFVEIGTLKRWFNNYGFGWFVNRNIFHYSFYNSLQRNHLDLYRISKHTSSGFSSQHIYNLIRNYKFVFPGALMENYCLDLLREKLISLKQLKPELKNDPSIIDLSVRCNGLNLEFVGKDYHRNEDLVRKAVSENGLALRFASKHLRMNEDIVKLACKQNKYALKYSLLREKEDTKTVSERFKDYFSLNKDPMCLVDRVFSEDEYMQKRILSFGFEYLTQFQIDMIRRCQKEGLSKNILFQAPSVGKTTASLIVAMERIERFKSKLGSGIHCLILCPNRELVILIERLVKCMMEDYEIVTSYGGNLHTYYFYNHKKYTVCTPMQIDFSDNTEPSSKPTILIGTPGRISDDIRSGMIHLNKVHTIIYEEADTLLNGEYHELKYVMREIEEYNPRYKLMNIILCQTLTERLYFRMDLTFNQELEYFYKDDKHALFNPLPLLKEHINHEIKHFEDLEEDKFYEMIFNLVKQYEEEDGIVVLFGNRNIIGNLDNSTFIIHSLMNQSIREEILNVGNSTYYKKFSTTDVNSNLLTLIGKKISAVFQLDFPSSEEIFSKRIRYAVHVNDRPNLRVVTIVTSKDQEKRILKWLR